MYIHALVAFLQIHIVQLQIGLMGNTQEADEYKPVKPQRGSGTRGVKTRLFLRLLLLYGHTYSSFLCPG